MLETGDGKPFAAVGWREVLTKRVQDRATLIVGQTVDDQPFVGRDLLLRPLHFELVDAPDRIEFEMEIGPLQQHGGEQGFVLARKHAQDDLLERQVGGIAFQQPLAAWPQFTARQRLAAWAVEETIDNLLPDATAPRRDERQVKVAQHCVEGEIQTLANHLPFFADIRVVRAQRFRATEFAIRLEGHAVATIGEGNSSLDDEHPGHRDGKIVNLFGSRLARETAWCSLRQEDVRHRVIEIAQRPDEPQDHDKRTLDLPVIARTVVLVQMAGDQNLDQAAAIDRDRQPCLFQHRADKLGAQGLRQFGAALEALQPDQPLVIGIGDVGRQFHAVFAEAHAVDDVIVDQHQRPGTRPCQPLRRARDRAQAAMADQSVHNDRRVVEPRDPDFFAPVTTDTADGDAHVRVGRRQALFQRPVSPVVQETDQRVYGGRLACRVLHHIDNLAAQGNWQAVMRFQGRP